MSPGAPPVQVHRMDYSGAEDHDQQGDVGDARVRQVRRRLGRIDRGYAQPLDVEAVMSAR